MAGRRPTPSPLRTLPVQRGPRELINAAAAALGHGHADQAIRALELAAPQALDNAAALGLWGKALGDLGALDAAEAALRRALELDAPAAPGAALALARLWLKRCRFHEAIALLEAELAAHPDDAGILVSLAQGLIGRKRLEEAKALLLRAAPLAPEDPWPHLALALVHFLDGDWPAAFAQYRWRRKLPGAYPTLPGHDRLWAGEDLAGKSILLFAEQGAGDSIQFLRFAPLLAGRGAKVWINCSRALLPIIRPSAQITPFAGPTRRRFEMVSSLVDVADILGVTPATVPPAQGMVAAPARDILPPPPAGTRLRIGICWSGNPAHANDLARSCGFASFLPLLAQAGVDMVSLQVGPGTAEIAAAGAGGMVADLSARLSDYGDTAAAISGLDLVISVDTSVAHLAGALGKPVWLLLPYLPDWRWGLEGESTPWYPSMRLFRQPKANDWPPVFAALETALAETLAGLPRPPISPEAAAEASSLHDRGMRLLESGKEDEAAELLRQALRRVGESPKTWNNLGVVLRRARHLIAAETAFRRSLAVHPGRGALGNLANTLTDLGRCAEADRLHLELMRDREPEASLLYNRGITLKQQGKTEAALATFEQAIALEPGYRDAHWDRSHALLQLGRWREGWKGYEVRWSLAEAGALSNAAPLWQGQDLKGRTILILPEQGFGDTLFAMRFLPLLKDRGATILVQCQPELYRLLKRSPWIDNLVPKGVDAATLADFQISAMSLPGLALELGESDPARGGAYLTADPALDDFVGTIIPVRPGGLNVGIVWTGSLTFKGNAYRRAALADFLPLAADPRIRLFSLQKGPAADDLEHAHAEGLVTPLGPLLTDFDVTAAMLARLDAVIMTDSSVAHLAGALGRPVWVVLGERAYWLWGEKTDRSVWYDSVRLIRKSTGQDWDGAIMAAAGDVLKTLA
ncbi:MAG: tetratricopeptide repeat protein [Magnetospirillum sp.]|nr:tetratricopeptide repeat protein [Magnetospirillum sp.]